MDLLIKSLIVGALCGSAVGAGAARMFYAPELMAAGAWRTLGEMNACLGSASSHFSFGLSYFLSSWVNNAAYGGMGQDFLHRTVPNVGAGILLLKNKDVKETVQNPFKMAIVCGVVGAVLYTIMNMSGSLVPDYVTNKMMDVFTPVANNLMIVMQAIYLIAAVENGVWTGCWGLALGAVSYLSTGNACAGLILGILTGKTIENNGIKSRTSIVFIILMTVIWGYIAWARGFVGKAIIAFQTFSALFGG